jgi:hypothetical protein
VDYEAMVEIREAIYRAGRWLRRNTMGAEWWYSWGPLLHSWGPWRPYLRVMETRRCERCGREQYRADREINQARPLQRGTRKGNDDSMTQREKRLVIRSLSLANGLLAAYDCPTQWREILLQYQWALVQAWGQTADSRIDQAERAELLAAVNDAISQLYPDARTIDGKPWQRH